VLTLARVRDHDNVGAVDILGRVADRNRDARLPQPRHVTALGGVRALHGITQIAQDLGDAAHADAADPDEVNGSDLARQSHGCSLTSSSAKAAFWRTLRLKSAAQSTGCPAFAGHDKAQNRVATP